MRTYQDILDTMEKLGITNSRIRNPFYGTRRELKELPKVLEEHEEILYMIPGAWQKNSWLIVCTNERVIFLDKGYIYRFNMKEIPIDRINSVESKRGLIFGQINMWDGANETIITQCLKADVQKFASAVGYAKNKKKDKFNQVDTRSKVRELQELQALLSEGVLTESEFEQEKQRILSR